MGSHIYDIFKAVAVDRQWTAAEKNGEKWFLYISTKSGVLRLSGPPITAAEVNLRRNRKDYTRCIPSINFHDVHASCVDIGAELKLTDSFDEHRYRLEESLKHLNLFQKEIVGASLFRRIRRFGSRHFELAFFASRLPIELGDLLNSNPTLAFAFAGTQDIMHDDLIPDIRRVLSRKQRELCEILGFPAASWRLLRKVLPKALDDRSIEVFRRISRSDKIVSVARHLPATGPESVAILTSDLLTA